MTIVYHQKDIDRKFFEIIRSRLSPCCSVASLYFWAAAGEAKEKAPAGSTKKQEVKKRSIVASKSSKNLYALLLFPTFRDMFMSPTALRATSPFRGG